jgi:thiol-disulfide isomerase/thioredoxin
MKKELLYLPMIILLLCSFTNGDDDILNKTSKKLNSIKTLEYNVTDCLHQDVTNSDDITSALCYFDFTSKDSLIGAKFFFHTTINGTECTAVFNGSQTFYSVDKEKRILYRNQPRIKDVTSFMFYGRSICWIRNILPQFINDPINRNIRLNDTIINNRECFRFHLSPNKFINPNGSVELVKNAMKYYIAISKDDSLPVQFTGIFPTIQSQITTFSRLKFPVQKSDSIWNYENFPKDYLRMSEQEYSEKLRNKLTQITGRMATDWELPKLNGGSVKLSDLKGNLVLLEFWFPGCGACLQAIPDINDIQQKYGSKGLNVFGIEFQQKGNKGLTNYIKKYNIKYPTLYNGKEVSTAYGATSGPTIILIGQDRKIIYVSSGFDKAALIKAIDEHIK